MLQPIVLGILVAILALWCMLPGGFKKQGLDNIQREREEGRSAASDENESKGLRRRITKLRSRLCGV